MEQGLELALSEIGHSLDRGSAVTVKNGGFVVPSTSPISEQDLGKELHHVASRERPKGQPGLRTGTWAKPTFESRPSARPRSPRPAAPLVVAELRQQYEKQLEAVSAAYPGTQHWMTDQGIWLVVESSLLPGFLPKACFAVGISLHEVPAVKAWGFWGTTVVGYEWIGPRHTNFPDGSICAYDIDDGTWEIGDSLIKLLDLYTVWAARHLHFRLFERWPGYQAVPHVYERVLELQPNELCGCANYHTFYRDCCESKDKASNIIQEAVRFMFFSRFALRQPPSSVVAFMKERRAPPELRDLFW